MKTMHGFSRLIGGLMIAALTALAGPAHATLIGSPVDIVFDGTNETADCNGVEVGATVECVGSSSDDDEFIDVDIFSSSIVVSFRSTTGSMYLFGPSIDAGTFDIVISGLNWVDDIAATIASINSIGTGLIGTQVSAAITGDNQITVTHNDPQAFCSLDCGNLEIEITPDHGSVPEPASLVLFAIALGGLGFMARRRVT